MAVMPRAKADPAFHRVLQSIDGAIRAFGVADGLIEPKPREVIESVDHAGFPERKVVGPGEVGQPHDVLLHLALTMALAMPLQGLDVLGGVAATVLLEKANFGLERGLQANDLFVRQVVGALDGDGEAVGLDDAVAVKLALGAHGCSPFVTTLVAGAWVHSMSGITCHVINAISGLQDIERVTGYVTKSEGRCERRPLVT
jgi:hypothetical protein